MACSTQPNTVRKSSRPRKKCDTLFLEQHTGKYVKDYVEEQFSWSGSTNVPTVIMILSHWYSNSVSSAQTLIKKQEKSGAINSL